MHTVTVTSNDWGRNDKQEGLSKIKHGEQAYPLNCCVRCVWVNVIFHSLLSHFISLLLSRTLSLILIQSSVFLFTLCWFFSSSSPSLSIHKRTEPSVFIQHVVIVVSFVRCSLRYFSFAICVHTTRLSHTNAPQPKQTYMRALVSIRLFDALVVVVHWLFDTLSIRSFHLLYYFSILSSITLAVWNVYVARCGIAHMHVYLCVCVFAWMYVFSLFSDKTQHFPFFPL